MTPKPWNQNMEKVDADEKIYIDYTLSRKPTCIKFKTSRPKEWIEIIRSNFKCKAGSVDEIRFKNIVINFHLTTGVVCIQGAGFLEFATKTFPLLKASLDNKQKPIADIISTINDLLRVNKWYVKKEPGDGHCLIHSIADTTSIEEDFIVKEIHHESQLHMKSYIAFLPGVKPRDFTNQVNAFLYKKQYNLPVVDVMPFIVSNALGLNIELVNSSADGSYSLFLIKPFEESQCMVSIVRKGDHFDALIPIENLTVENMSLNEDEEDSIVFSDSVISPASLRKCDSGISLLSPLPIDMMRRVSDIVLSPSAPLEIKVKTVTPVTPAEQFLRVDPVTPVATSSPDDPVNAPSLHVDPFTPVVSSIPVEPVIISDNSVSETVVTTSQAKKKKKKRKSRKGKSKKTVSKVENFYNVENVSIVKNVSSSGSTDVTMCSDYEPDPHYVLSDDESFSCVDSNVDCTIAGSTQFELVSSLILATASVWLNILASITDDITSHEESEAKLAEENASTDVEQIIGIGTSLIAGVGPGLAKLGLDNTAYCYRGAEIPLLRSRIPNIISSDMKNKNVSIYLQCAGNDCDKHTASDVVGKYEDLIHEIRNLCPKSKIIACRIPHRLKNPETSKKIDRVNHYLLTRSLLKGDIDFVDSSPSPKRRYFKEDGVHLRDNAKEHQIHTIYRHLHESSSFHQPQIKADM